MKNYYSSTGILRAVKSLIIVFILSIFGQQSFSQTTYNFSTPATLSSPEGTFVTQALVTIGGVVYKLSHLGNGHFTNQTSGGNGNSAYLKKDGSGGDFLRIERNDAQPFQFYGMWLNTSSMYSLPFYFPPYYNIKYYDENGVEIVAETFSSSVQYETITVVKNLKVKYVYVTLNAITVYKLDDLIVGPAAASAPTVTTAAINQFTANSCLAGGNVTSDGAATVTERGIVYGTSTNPTVANTKIAIGSGTGAFTQTISGLNSGTQYYVRSYATNSAGTNYGSNVNFTTAPAFVLAQIHYFNTTWLSTTAQPTPFTKYVEGWNVTAAGTGTGTITISRLTATTGTASVAEGVGALRALSVTSTEQISTVKFKASDNSLFKLKGFKFKYVTRVLNTSFGTMTITGYLNGVAVPGAVLTLTGVAQATSAAYAYTTVDVSANNNFNSIDEFGITASDPVSSAKLQAMDFDMLEVGTAVTVPLVLTDFGGKLVNSQSFLSWKTSQEQNTKDFDVQYSTDGNQFTGAGKVTAAGNSTSDKTYSFIHNYPGNGNNYYRLKMNDQDGKSSYSRVINLKMSEVKTGLSVYPNPVIGDHFYVNTPSTTTLPLNYKFVNADGKTVQKGTISTHSQKISLPTLDKGNYFIQLSNGQTAKIVL